MVCEIYCIHGPEGSGKTSFIRFVLDNIAVKFKIPYFKFDCTFEDPWMFYNDQPVLWMDGGIIVTRRIPVQVRTVIITDRIITVEESIRSGCFHLACVQDCYSLVTFVVGTVFKGYFVFMDRNAAQKIEKILETVTHVRDDILSFRKNLKKLQEREKSESINPRKSKDTVEKSVLRKRCRLSPPPLIRMVDDAPPPRRAKINCSISNTLLEEANVELLELEREVKMKFPRNRKKIESITKKVAARVGIQEIENKLNKIIENRK